MPGLFAMKRESWARLVRVSSLPCYAPSRRIAKGLSLSRFSLWTTAGTTSQPPDSGNVRSVHFQPRSPSLSSVVRRSLPADGTKGDPLCPTSSFPEWSGVEWRGEGRRIHTRILVTLIPCPCTERPSGRPPTRRISRFTQGRISFFINAGILGTYLSLKGCVTFGGSELVGVQLR